MFVVANVLMAIAGVLEIVIEIYMYIVIIAALISWVNPDPYNPIVRFLYSVTEPVFSAVRRVLPFRSLRIDISPIIVLVIAKFLQIFLQKTLMSIAASIAQ
jgi:YggT family protein